MKTFLNSSKMEISDPPKIPRKELKDWLRNLTGRKMIQLKSGALAPITRGPTLLSTSPKVSSGRSKVDRRAVTCLLGLGEVNLLVGNQATAGQANRRKASDLLVAVLEVMLGRSCGGSMYVLGT